MQVLARGHVGYGVELDAEGSAEQDPQLWLDAVQGATRDAVAEAADALEISPIDVCRRVAGVGVSGQQHGLVALDANDRPVRPAKLWCDTSTAQCARELSAALGRPIPVGFTASKVRWLANHEPDVWAKVRRVMLPHDFINFALTGQATAESGDASGTGWFDPDSRDWDRHAMGVVDARLHELVPPVLPVGAAAGLTQPSVEAWLGLPAGIPVAAGGGDNMLSAIGAGAVEPGPVVMSLGTSGTVFCYNDRPIVDPSGLIAPFLGSAGGALPLLCVMNCTGVLEEVVRAFGCTHAELTARASALPPGSTDLHPHGLMWLPLIAGERTPDLPEAAGRLLGMRPGSLDPGRMYRAAIEGVSFLLAAATDRLRAEGVQVNRVRLVGGAAANPLWRQVLADSIGTEVQRLAESESAAFGGALQACWTVARATNPQLAIADVVRGSIEIQEQVDPSDAQLAYRPLRERFERELAKDVG